MKIAVRMDDGTYTDATSGRTIARPSKLKAAVQHPHYSELVVLPDNSILTRAKAQSQGYTITTAAGTVIVSGLNRPARMTDAGMQSEAARYRAEIMALPEAQERPATAEKIATAYGFNSLPVARAATMLRGLPSEIDELASRITESRAERAAAAVPEDPKLQRRVELRILGLRAAIDPEDRRERTALTLALAVANADGIAVTAALARVGIDAARFSA